MDYAVEMTGRGPEGLFVHFFRDEDAPCAVLAVDVAKARAWRDGYRDMRVLGVQRREAFDVEMDRA